MNYPCIISIGDPTSRESSRAAASTDRCFPGQGGPRLLGQHRQALRVQAQVSDREEAEDRDGRTSRKIFFPDEKFRDFFCSEDLRSVECMGRWMWLLWLSPSLLNQKTQARIPQGIF